MSKTRPRSAIIGAAWLLIAGSPASAHHSEVMYDHGKTIVVDGTVKEFRFANPHSILTLTAKKADGTEAEWKLDTGGPSGLLRFGVDEKSFLAGERLTVTAYPLRSGALGGAIIRVVKPDGATFVIENAR